MAQEGISTLPQSPENQMPAGADLDATKNAVLQQIGPEPMAQYEQAMDQATQQLNLPMEQLALLLQVLEYILKNGDNYAKVRQELISQGGIRAEDLPEEFDKAYFTTLLVMVKEAIKRAQGSGTTAQMPAPQGFRNGGLADVAESLRQKGRGGDTILAHINPQEAMMLKAMGGSGTINPATGLPEFFLKKIGINLGDAWNSVKQVAAPIINSPVGKIVVTAALTYALGPAGGGLVSLPAAAAISAGAVSLAGGADLKTALISSALAGGTAYFLPDISKAMPGAQGSIVNSALTAGAIGTGAGLAMGQPLGQAFKTGALTGLIGGGVQAGMNYYNTGQAGFMEAPQARGTDIQTGPGGTRTDLTPPDATTQASNITQQGGSVTPTQVSRGIEELGTFNYDVEAQPGGFYGGRTPTPQEYGAVQYGLANPTPPSSSFMDTAKTAGTNLLQSVKDFYVDPTTGSVKLLPTVGTVLAAGALTGQYTPTQPSPPGVVQREPSGRPTTGEDLVNRDPNKYLVGNIPGFNAPIPEQARANLVASPSYGGYQPNYPTYTPPAMGVTARPPEAPGIPQPFNTADMYDFFRPVRYAAKGGISNVYPRKTGKIDGPGTGTSDSIPAMLSDGEFVITAKAVRGAGNGSRREGAKKLYRMMHALEKKA